MPEFLVTWKIDIDNCEPLMAAQEALAIQRDYESEALVFEVRNKKTNEEYLVDLSTDYVKKRK